MVPRRRAPIFFYRASDGGAGQEWPTVMETKRLNNFFELGCFSGQERSRSDDMEEL